MFYVLLVTIKLLRVNSNSKSCCCYFFCSSRDDCGEEMADNFFCYCYGNYCNSKLPR